MPLETLSRSGAARLSKYLISSHTLSLVYILLCLLGPFGPCLIGWPIQSVNGVLWSFFLVVCTFTWCCLLASSSHSERETMFLFLWKGGSNVLSLLVEVHRRDYVGMIVFKSFNTSLNLSEANFVLPLPHSLDTMGTESLHHGMVWVRMDLQRSSSPNPPAVGRDIFY